jgi:PAS domain S-box-containing protein
MPQSPSHESLKKRLKTLEAKLSEKEKSGKHLKQQLEDYRQIVENLNDVVYQLDIEGRFTYVNRVIEYMTGYKPEELLGRRFHEFVHPDDLPFLQEKFRTRVSVVDAPPQAIDFRAIKKSGEYMWLRTSSRRLRHNGKVVGLTGIWTDIHARKQAEAALKNVMDQLEERVAYRTQELQTTNIQLEQEMQERKTAESALRESETHLRSLMEAASNFAVYRLVYDETNPSKSQVVFASPSLVELIGISPTDKFEKWHDIIHPQDIERVNAANLQMSETHVFNETFRIYHSLKKKWRYINAVSTGILDRSGRIKYVNGLFIDVSEKKLAEEALKKRERELAIKSRHLEEVNTALRVLLEKREEDRSEIEGKIEYNLRELVLPYLEKLKKTSLNEKQASYLKVAESNLENIVSPFSKSLSEKFLNLTPTELQVANLIQQGRSTKEIAQLLFVSNRTVESHRKGIRKKLNLNNRKANLRSHLTTLNKGPI